MLQNSLRALAGSPGLCALLLSDSDDGVEDRLRELASGALEGFKCRVLHTASRYAAECSGSHGTRFLALVWKCSAECWIASLAGQDRGGLEGSCDSSTRRECHRLVDQLLGGLNVEERVRRISELIEDSPPVSRSIVEELRKLLRDGAHS
ncbi:hypothetical protein [Pyrodictium abyssi]|uniref:Uncharacterized protein n=1 Tax=Pyrodictium abyssi TaxID=54256 RepID=A0ABM8IZ04_9CREN|nr:hypothetical protein PABY_23370 [Pyrodictium abyssi]